MRSQKYMFVRSVCLQFFLVLLACFPAVAAKLEDPYGIVIKYAGHAKDANSAYEAAKSNNVPGDVIAALKIAKLAAELRSESVKKNFDIAQVRFNEFIKLEDQIGRLAQKHDVPEKYQEIIKISNGKTVEVRKTLERNWKTNLENLDKESAKLERFGTKLKMLKTVADATKGLADAIDVGNEAYKMVANNDESMLDKFGHVTSILRDGIPYVTKAAEGPFLAAEISGWLAATTIKMYTNALADLGEEELKTMREAEAQFNFDVNYYIETEILNSKGKPANVVEENIRKKIAARASKFSKLLSPPDGVFYEMVFGNCENQFFCTEAAVNKMTNGALVLNFRQLQDFIAGLSFQDSAKLIQYLNARKVPEKIRNVLAFYESSQEVIKNLDELHKLMRNTPPIKVSLPQLPTPNTSKNQPNIRVFRASATEITAGTEAKNTVSFNTTTNVAASSVFATITKDGVKEREFDFASANKIDWTSSLMSFATPGKRTITAYLKDNNGNIVAGSESVPVAINVLSPSEVIENNKANIPTTDIVKIYPETGSMNAGDFITIQIETKKALPQTGSVVLNISDSDELKTMNRLAPTTWTATFQMTKVGKRILEAIAYNTQHAIDKNVHGTTQKAIINVQDKPNIFSTASIIAIPNTTSEGDIVKFVARTSRPAVGGQKVLLRLKNPEYEADMQLDPADLTKTTWVKTIPVTKVGERPIYAIAVETNGNHNNMVRGLPLTITPAPTHNPQVGCTSSQDLLGSHMNVNCYCHDNYYRGKGLEGKCSVARPDGTSDQIVFKLKQHSTLSVDLPPGPGKVFCSVYLDDGKTNNQYSSHWEFMSTTRNSDDVKKLYQSFTDYYNSKQDSRLLSLISDDWESTGDGTTLADLETNFRNSFRIFDQVTYNIQGLTITSLGSNKFRVSYDALIKGQIYKNGIKHEEKSNVSEEVTIDASGKAKITKTLSGRFWYVQ